MLFPRPVFGLLQASKNVLRFTADRALRTLSLAAGFAAALCTSHAQQTVVANYSGNSLVVLDLATGDRTILSDAATGTGPLLNRPVAIAREASGSILIGEDRADSPVVRIDPLTGNRSLVSSSARGTGPLLQRVYGMTVDSAGSIYAASVGTVEIIKIDPQTGDRTVIASQTVGSGASFSAPWGLAAEPNGDIVAVLNAGALIRINPTTGVRTVVSSADVGSGPLLTNATGMARLPDGAYVVLNRIATDYLIRVDPVTGNRTAVTSSTIGTGATIGLRYGVSFDSNGTIYIADFGANSVLRIDPVTGDRTTIASAAIGTGPALSAPLGILPNAVASVTQPEPAPTITSATSSSGTYGSAFTYTITATDAPTSFAATGLPSGLSLNTTTGEITGTPTQTGSFTVSLDATNGGGTGSATLTLTVAKKALSVAGLVVSDKPYDGTTSATIIGSSASLTGVVGSDDVSLDLSHVAASFDSSAVGTGKPVSVSGAALQGAASSHYTLTFPALTGNIVNANATVTLSGLSQTYSGTPRSASATTSPSGLTVTLTYDGASTAPTNAGSYAVVATIHNASYQGSASGTLVIAKASQSLSFNAPAEVALNTPVSLSASATSGLPVVFSVVSGNASLSGNSVTLNRGPSAVIRATQAGNSNFLSATADRTISADEPPAKLAQSISFTAPGDKSASAAPFALQATASSGLPVTFTVVSGPALLSGNTVTLTGAPGTIVLSAAQAGNEVYEAAPTVTHSVVVTAVGPQVFFGQSTQGDEIAANVNRGNSEGQAIGYLSGSKQAFVANFTVGADGSLSGTAEMYSGTSPSTASVAADARSGKNGAPKTRVASAPTGTRVVSGSLVNGVLVLVIADLPLFNAALQPPTGATAPVAGYYEAVSTNTAGGSIYSVVGTQGRVFALAITPSLITGGTGTLNAKLAFAIPGTDSATLNGAIDAQNAAISGHVATAGATNSSFAGTRADVIRTDRLINLSSRASIGPDANRTLITGFVIGGHTTKRVLVRAVGPGLAKLGVTNAIANPRLRLFNAKRELIHENDDWNAADATAMAQVGAFAFTAGSQDAALVLDLAPGAYTMHVTDGDASGVTLAEIYDASANPQSEYQRLINISSRGYVTSGEGVLIGGFIVTGNTPKRVLIRGVGPGLTALGVNSALSDPAIEVYNKAGTMIAKNDNWETGTPLDAAQRSASATEITSANREAGAFALAGGSRDSALIVTLAPGLYTTMVKSANGTPGVALIEVYEMAE